MAADHQQGLLLIPDISGFTEFVTEVEISHSEHIITELLELLINTNTLGLELCEIEGDALFFYRGGDLPTLDGLIDQTRLWYLTFHTHLNLLKRDAYCKCGACQTVGNLGLKVVAHTGDFAAYTLGNKVKVIGKDVIVVHRMLKNRLKQSEYLLLSEAVLNSTGEDNSHGWTFTGHKERYDVIGQVDMGYAELAPLLAEVPPTPPHDDIPTLSGSFSEEIEINASLEAVAETLSDVSAWTEWIEGLVTQRIDRSAPIKPGHHHICVFPGQNLSITLDQLRLEKNEFTLVESIAPPSQLKKLMIVFRAEKVKKGVVKVQQRFIYARKPIIGLIFEFRVAPQLQAQSRQNLLNLKALLEGGVGTNAMAIK